MGRSWPCSSLGAELAPAPPSAEAAALLEADKRFDAEMAEGFVGEEVDPKEEEDEWRGE